MCILCDCRGDIILHPVIEAYSTITWTVNSLSTLYTGVAFQVYSVGNSGLKIGGRTVASGELKLTRVTKS